jgi:hypothetical protein
VKLLWHVGEPDLYVTDNQGGALYRLQVSNAVRNSANGRRSLENPEDVVYTTPGDGSKPWPYMPTGFPPGKWEILAVLPRTSDYLAPFFLATDAWRKTPSWSLSPAGDYDKPTGQLVRDAGFGLHFAQGTTTTLGCLRLLIRKELETLAALCQEEIKAGRKIPFEVKA